MNKVEKCENEEARHILARLEEEFMGRPTIADALRRGREAIKRMEDNDGLQGGGQMKVYITLLKHGEHQQITGVYKTKRAAQKAIAIPEGYFASGLCHEIIEEHEVEEADNG